MNASDSKSRSMKSYPFSTTTGTTINYSSANTSIVWPSGGTVFCAGDYHYLKPGTRTCSCGRVQHAPKLARMIEALEELA